jgi:cellulose synthase (UDP-forming)
VQVQFQEVSLAQQRQLVELLFCRPGQWKSRRSPGELQSLWILLRTLFWPRALMRQAPMKAVSVVPG